VIVDTSAIVAIFVAEPGHEEVLRKLSQATVAGVGAPTLAETGIVLAARLGRDPRSLLLRFLQESGIAAIPFGEAHWREAVEAYARFGRGRHRAGLNFGDCLSYATARLAGRPLLCVGNDFKKTDLALA
jgi:ribonuclease VapC